MGSTDFFADLLDDLDGSSQNNLDTDDEKSYFVINFKFLAPDSARDFDLYIRQNDRFVLYRSSDMDFTENDMEKLRERGNRALYVRKEQRGQFMQFIESSLQNILMDDSVPMDERSNVLYDASVGVVGDLYTTPISVENLQRSKTLVGNVVQFVQHSQDALPSLLLQPRSDSPELLHGINSCICAVGSSEKFNIQSREDVNSLGIGCLLKDLGMKLIPEEVQSRMDNPTEEDLQYIKQHPLLAAHALENAGGLSELTRICIINHHEHLDGSGYPRGISSDELHLFGRIAQVIDTFNGLSTLGEDGETLSAFQALMQMKNNMQGKMDTGVFRQLVLTLGSQ